MFFTAFLIVVTAVLTGAGVLVLAHALNAGLTRRLPLALLWCVLYFYGIGGFLGTALAAIGLLDRAGSFEWPVGYSTSVLRTREGNHVVAHAPTGRVQVYDADLRFVRGWRVDGAGGPLAVRPRADGMLDVYTSRGRRHFVYDQAGGLRAAASFTDLRLLGRPPEAAAMFVPTRWWLWPLSHPFLGFACWLLLVPLGYLTRTRPERGKPHHTAARSGRSSRGRAAGVVIRYIGGPAWIVISLFWFGSISLLLIRKAAAGDRENRIVLLFLWLIGLGLCAISLACIGEVYADIKQLITGVPRARAAKKTP